MGSRPHSRPPLRLIELGGAARDLMTADRLERGVEVRPRWALEPLRGRLVELSSAGSGASLSFAFSLIRDAWSGREPAAWVSVGRETFYPPDVADGGLSLERLPVIRVDAGKAAARAASHLLRSGAWGLVVLDLGRDAVLPMPLIARLAKLATTHEAAVVCVTAKPDDAPSIGSLISLRCVSRIVRELPGRFRAELTAVKDKRRAPGWTCSEVRRGPLGLR